MGRFCLLLWIACFFSSRICFSRHISAHIHGAVDAVYCANFLSQIDYIPMWSFGDTVRTLVTSDSFVDKIVTTIVEYHTLVVLIDQFVTFRGVSSIGFYHVHYGISYRLGVSFLCAFRSLVYYMHHVDIRQTALSFLTECHKEEEAIIAIPEVPPLYGYHGEPILEGGDMRRMQALQQSRVFRLWKGSHHKEVVKWKRLEIPGLSGVLLIMQIILFDNLKNQRNKRGNEKEVWLRQKRVHNSYLPCVVM